jgi:NAD(P)H dehydrogenase (quinone)
VNVLWVFAHPEPCSLNGSLRDEGLRALTEAGHTYELSDLYAMGSGLSGHYSKAPGT